MSISNQRTHILTPIRKRMGKSIARRSNKALADECMKSDSIRKYILQRLGVLLRYELKTMCSDAVNSVLKCKLDSEHNLFCWEMLHSELSIHAPLLLHILTECTKTHHKQNNRTAVIGMCCCILLKYRYMKMSAIQRIISIILYAGHSSKMVCSHYIVYVTFCNTDL